MRNLVLFAPALLLASPALAAEQPTAQPHTQSTQPAPRIVSQGDPEVADIVLSRHGTTVSEIGCLGVAFWHAMVRLGHEQGPRSFFESLVANNMFTSGGLLRWAVGSLFQIGIEQLWRNAWRTTERGLAILREHMAQGKQVLLEYAYLRGGKLRTHWVLADRFEGGVLYAVDSDGGVIRPADQIRGGLRNLRRLVILTN